MCEALSYGPTLFSFTFVFSDSQQPTHKLGSFIPPPIPHGVTSWSYVLIHKANFWYTTKTFVSKFQFLAQSLEKLCLENNRAEVHGGSETAQIRASAMPAEFPLFSHAPCPILTCLLELGLLLFH